MLVIDHNRRRHTRVTADRPCKVFDPRSHKYLAAETCNLSSGGAMIRLPHGLDISPGERLFVGIAQKRRQVLLHAADMAHMRVVRTMHAADGSMCLGLELIDAQPECAVETRRAA